MLTPAPPSSQKSATSQASSVRRGGLQLVVFLVLAVGLPALVPYHARKEATSSRDTISRSDQIERLEKERPDIVLLGNSMLPCRIDPKLAAQISGRRFSTLPFNGSASAAWFLLVKNVVCEVQPPPGAVVILFRDTVFHLPVYRTTGQRQALIDSLRAGAEPELEQALSGASKHPSVILDGLADVVDATWRIDGYQRKMEDRISELAMDLSMLKSPGRGERREIMQKIFALHNLRGDLAADLEASQMGRQDNFDDESRDFTTRPEDTLLPSLLDTCRQHGVRLCLFRVRRRDHAEGPEPREPEEVATYIAAMKAWAENEGVFWVDESDDPDLGIEHFSDGDHIKPESLHFWTEKSIGRLQPVLKSL